MTRRTFQWTTIAVAVAVMGTFNVAFADVDVTTPGAEVTLDGAVYIQGPLPGSAGTGLIDPFLTDGGGGSQDITRSYNTDFGAQAGFDMVFGGGRTHSLNLAAVPEQEYPPGSGVIYKEFVLDINKAPGGSPYLAMNELQLWLTTDPNLTGYDLTTYGFPAATGATKIFDLDEGSDGDSAVLMDYSTESGSGRSDLTWLVPLSVFDGELGDCTYGNTACTTYVVLFNEYGDYVEAGADPDKWVNNDGFEEWGTVLRPVVEVTKDAAGTYERIVDWTIEKAVDPDLHALFAGDPAGTSGYSITVTKDESPGTIAAGGTITIFNPTGGGGNPIEDSIPAVILSVEDVITQGAVTTDATIVDCTVDDSSVLPFPYTLGAGESLVCTYTASPGSPADGVNEATVEIEGLVDTSTFSGTATLLFTGTLIGFDSINVDDTNPGGDFGPVSATTTHTYTGLFDCAGVTYVNGFATYDVPNTATIVEEGDSSSANVTVNCYAPVVTKNVESSPFNREYQWEITKTPDATYEDFIGDPANTHTYTIEVDKLDATIDSGYRVEGSIFIDNNRPDAAMNLTSVSDSVDGVSAVVICPSLVVPASGQLECTYDTGEVSDLDGDETLNTATVVFNSIDYGAEASFTYEVGTTTNDQINVTDSASGEADQEFGPFTDDDSVTYDRDFQCPTSLDAYDGTGFYDETRVNTATIDEDTDQFDDATVTLNCYRPFISKDASASYDERHEWDVEKTVDPLSQKGFPGDILPWTWTIVVSEDVFEEDFAVTGDIDVSNPAGSPGNLTMSLVDVLDDTTVATVDCGSGATSVTVAPGATEICTYSAAPAGDSATENTATGTFNGIDFVATAGFEFVVNIIRGTATLSDEQIGLTDQSVTDGSTFTGPDSHTCSRVASLYAGDGMYSDSESNLATLTDSDGGVYTDDATTEYACYAPVITKDADGSYIERHDWDVEKTVDPTSQSGYPGDELDWTWTITITETVTDEDFEVEGVISVFNPASSPGNMTVSLSDSLSSGEAATVDCDGAGATSITVAPGATGNCDYSAEPEDADAGTNTATGTFNGVAFVASADYTFEKKVENDSATVTDDEIGLDETVFDSDEFTGDDSETCSTDWTDYDANGEYGETIINTAVLTDEEGTVYEDDATTEWLCEAGRFTLLKKTQGVVDPNYDWMFELYEGPDGFDGTQVGTTSSTLGDADGVLEFGNPALSPDEIYTVCELDVAAVWIVEWKIDTDGDGVADTIIIPYNPNADDSPPQDLGNRCYDFGVEVGLTLVIEVNNDFPGGNPRTPGYWKNWSSCTNGNQYDKTTDDVDPDNEFISLDEVLADPGIIWDDILDDDFVFPITECEDAVLILDNRINVGPKYRKSSKYGANALAKHLLAYQLNQGAGACYPAGQDQYILGASEGSYPAGTPCPVGSGLEGFASCDTLAMHAIAAETLLDSLDFDNTEGLLRPKGQDSELYWTARDLAMVLDLYNNGAYCGDTMP